MAVDVKSLNNVKSAAFIYLKGADLTLVLTWLVAVEEVM